MVNLWLIYGLSMINDWLVVLTILKNMKVSWDDYSHILWKNKTCLKQPRLFLDCLPRCQKVWNHQPDEYLWDVYLPLPTHVVSNTWTVTRTTHQCQQQQLASPNSIWCSFEDGFLNHRFFCDLWKLWCKETRIFLMFPVLFHYISKLW